MPEGNSDAMLLIAISWQAMKRREERKTIAWITDSIINVLFMSFYIEANLRYIMETLKDQFPVNPPNEYSSMMQKLTFLDGYFSCLANDRKVGSDGWRPSNEDLFEEYQGLQRINDFRDSISHGRVIKASKEVVDEGILRDQAKEIVNKIFEKARGAGFSIQRSTDYIQAIGEFGRESGLLS